MFRNINLGGGPAGRREQSIFLRSWAGGGWPIRDAAGYQPALQLCQWESARLREDAMAGKPTTSSFPHKSCALRTSWSKTVARLSGGLEGGAMYGWQATVGTDGKGAKSVRKGTENSKLLAHISGYLRVLALICGFGKKLGSFRTGTSEPSHGSGWECGGFRS